MWSPPGTPPLTRLYWPVLTFPMHICFVNQRVCACMRSSSSLVSRHCHRAFSATCARDTKERAVILGSGSMKWLQHPQTHQQTQIRCHYAYLRPRLLTTVGG